MWLYEFGSAVKSLNLAINKNSQQNLTTDEWK